MSKKFENSNLYIFSSPLTNDEYPFWVSQGGRTNKNHTSHQIRINSDISCLQYVISGSGVINSNNKSFVVNQGDTFLLSEGNNQNYYSNPGVSFERIWINFKGVFGREILKIYNIDDIIVFRNLNTMHLIEEMHQICKSTDDTLKLKNAVSIQFLKIAQFLSEHHSKITENGVALDTIRHYIDCHITENIKLSDVSEFSHFTPEHIIRSFKKKYGITPHRYIINSKIEIASILLRGTDKSIEQISSELGFSDPHHFSSLFEKKIGIRPSSYRKKSYLSET